MTTPALPQPACLVTQSCLGLCNPMDCSLPGSSVNGILQARILEWVATSSSRGSSWPRDRTPVSYITGRFFTIWATREALTLNDMQIGHWINGYVNMVLLLLRKYNLTHLWNISCTHPTKYRNTCSFSVIIHTNVQVKNTACLPFPFSKFFPLLWVKFLPHSQSFSRPLLVYLIGT